MKRTVFWCFFLLISIFLFGCQPQNQAAEAEEVKSESEVTVSDRLLIKGDIEKVELSETKGIAPVVYEAADELEIMQETISSSIRQQGVVNVTDSEFYLKVVMADGEEHYLQLWLGGEGEPASLMNADDTHSLYSVAPEVNAKLIELVKE